MSDNTQVMVGVLGREKSLELVSNLIENIKATYGLCDQDIVDVLKFGNSSIKIPVNIFSSELSPAMSLVKYLKENMNMKYSQIAQTLKRDDRGIWSTYNVAAKKYPQKFEVTSKVMIPIEVFSDRKYSIFESLITYMKNVLHVDFKDIAEELGKSPSTIYTVYRRARLK